jgi:PAS domain-containing protein
MRWRRFLIVAAVVAAGGAAVLEFSARSAAVDIAHALEPMATLTYDSAGIASNGSIRLQNPRLVVKHGPWQGSVRARLARLRGSGPFWLLGRFFSADAAAPADLDVETWGLRLGAEGADVPLVGWFGTADLALFENIGCGSDALSDKDRERMGVDTLERVDHFHYQFDAGSRQLRLAAELHSPQIADIVGTAEISGFDGSHWQDPKAQTAARLTRAGLSYRDTGYLGRRNNFCAQWLGISASEFIGRHVEAVEVFLSAHGIEPSREVRALYQQLVTRGGSLSLTSLPDASWVPVEIAAYPREDLLRQLNVTARLEDAPPIMLRLAFSEPETPLNLAAVTDPPVSPAIVDDAAVEPVGAQLPVAATSPVDTDSAAPGNTGSKPTPESGPGSATGTGVDTLASAPVEQAARDSPVADNPTRKDNDRRVIASSPPPPQDSTLALVWKPGVIERLPAQAEKRRDYSVVPVDRLKELGGLRVAIVTTSGKLVEGEVKESAADHVVLQVQVGRGLAELNVPLTRIREIRVPVMPGRSP